MAHPLSDELQRRIASLKKGGVDVIVGFTAAYAVYVHEDLEAHHPVGQAKFLEEPARVNKAKYAATVVAALKRKLTLVQALLLAGLQLQADAQKLCPVDTGALRASAFTRVDV